MIRHHERPRKTVQDYMCLPVDVRAELIDGEFFMTPSPRDRHQQIVVQLTVALYALVSRGSLGQVRTAPLDVHLPSGDIVQPDVIFVATANAHVIQDWIRGTPDLLIEVISPGNPERDRIVKRQLYARNGVREYWLIDDHAGSVEVLELPAGATEYAPHGYFLIDETIESIVLADLQLQVRDVLA